MSSATLHLKPVECCCATTVPRANFAAISKPSCSLLSIRQIHFSSSSISLKSKNLPFRIVPFVAQTSDWAQQDEADASVEENVDSDGGNSEEGDTEEECPEEIIEEDETEDSEPPEEGETEDSDPPEEVETEDSITEPPEEDETEDSIIEPPEEAKLFVGNLPYDVDSEKLAALFNEAGVVEISEVIYNRQTDQSRGFGFVTMSTVEEAEKAVELFSGYDINGRLLTVNKAAPRGSQPERAPRVYEPSFRIYVGNLPWRVDNDRLVELFSEFGKVVDARVVLDRESGRSRGFGFVTMETKDEVDEAITALDGQELEGRAIRVNVAEERPPRPRRDF